MNGGCDFPYGESHIFQHLATAAASYKDRPARPLLGGWVSDCGVAPLEHTTPNPGLILSCPAMFEHIAGRGINIDKKQHQVRIKCAQTAGIFRLFF